jgi:YjeF C-terminal domain protein
MQKLSVLPRKAYFCRMKRNSPLPITPEWTTTLLRPRPAEGHKGTFGHMLLVAGCHGMMGAALLAARAALRSGVGKLTAHIPERANTIFQTALPEAVLSFDTDSSTHWSTPEEPRLWQSVVIGPGIGREGETQWALRRQLHAFMAESESAVPLLLDADALNLLAADYQMLSFLPKGTILTPHLGEMKRLCQALDLPWALPEDCAASSLTLATEMQLYIVLKNHHTQIFTPTGETYINLSQGNAGMATAGSGDVLAGLIGGLLAQGYPRRDAAVLGVFLHATAGDLAARELGQHSLIASDLIDYLPDAFLSLLPASV